MASPFGGGQRGRIFELKISLAFDSGQLVLGKKKLKLLKMNTTLTKETVAEFAQNWTETNLPFSNTVKAQAKSVLENNPFPNTRVEAWKYTRLTKISKQSFTNAPGTVNDLSKYKVLKDAPGTEYIHPVTQQTYRFDGSTFWSYDTPRDIKLKADYAKKMGMGGIFSWEADGDTNDGALVEAMTHINK